MVEHVKVQELKNGADGWKFLVTVKSGNGTETRHKVHLSYGDRERLAPDADPDEIVEESFRFLLDREPKESILESFDLPVISRYFPEYDEEISELV